ncbi:MAG TPA: hypothetical protein VHV53_10350 [Solirubrobacterales bacterium]|nr:hypothetical protein [Solirubrobacterales bacterium]
MKLAALVTVVVLGAAVLVAGCGGGSSSTAPGGGAAANEAGAKTATAPNAPAGSRVVTCSEGRGETEQLRAAAVDCATARATMRRWERSHACTLGRSGSRSSCSLGAFRCQAVRVDRGAEVSCARPDGDVSFIAKAWLLRKTPSG